mmetsp:Transcript_15481/g.42714  ORF Transcript_15481/g.42714 Transcript_15481/m.42714 type:complete len:223 (-) Transcript_15481:505-1173(-)
MWATSLSWHGRDLAPHSSHPAGGRPPPSPCRRATASEADRPGTAAPEQAAPKLRVAARPASRPRPPAGNPPAFLGAPRRGSARCSRPARGCPGSLRLVRCCCCCCHRRPLRLLQRPTRGRARLGTGGPGGPCTPRRDDGTCPCFRLACPDAPTALSACTRARASRPWHPGSCRAQRTNLWPACGLRRQRLSAAASVPPPPPRLPSDLRPRAPAKIASWVQAA